MVTLFNVKLLNLKSRLEAPDSKMQHAGVPKNSIIHTFCVCLQNNLVRRKTEDERLRSVLNQQGA